MTHDHGTRERYVSGPDENGTAGKGCRCAACRRANRAPANERYRLIAYGRWQPFVDAGRAREHLRMLSAHGVGWKRAAELAGVAPGSVSRLLYGGPGDRPPARRIRPETEAKILAVRPGLDSLGATVPVDATGTRRRLEALIARGWSQSRLAARLSMLPGNFSTTMRSGRVHAATARAVRDLYSELQDELPPEGKPRDKMAASRARNQAAARGWAPPAAWDDIDDPDASPRGWRRPGAGQGPRGARPAADAREPAALMAGHSCVSEGDVS